MILGENKYFGYKSCNIFTFCFTCMFCSHSYKSGNVLPQKPELMVVHRERKLEEKRKEQLREQKSRRTSMEIKLLERQEKERVVSVAIIAFYFLWNPIFVNKYFGKVCSSECFIYFFLELKSLSFFLPVCFLCVHIILYFHKPGDYFLYFMCLVRASFFICFIVPMLSNVFIYLSC